MGKRFVRSKKIKVVKRKRDNIFSGFQSLSFQLSVILFIIIFFYLLSHLFGILLLGSPLHYAAIKGNTWAMKVLIKCGADVNSLCPSSGLTPLHYAARNGDIETVRFLLKNGADVNQQSVETCQTPLEFALARENNREVIKLLRDNNAIGYEKKEIHKKPVIHKKK